jgi:hypothetical protein
MVKSAQRQHVTEAGRADLLVWADMVEVTTLGDALAAGVAAGLMQADHGVGE